MGIDVFLRIGFTLFVSIVLTACGGTTTTAPATAATLSMSFTSTKTFRFAWTGVSDATSYKLKEAVTTDSGYVLINEVASNGFDHLDGTGTNRFDHVVPLYGRLNAKYILQSCNSIGCTDSPEVFTSTKVAQMVDSIGYFKASNTGTLDNFGFSVALSSDGNTLAVGAMGESSNATGINGDQTDNSLAGAGAAYVFTRTGTTWSQQAYLKASNTGVGDRFGFELSLSSDGNTLAIGAPDEKSNATGINGNQTDNSLAIAGAAYVFTRTGATWSQQAYLKASNTSANDYFGLKLSLSSDGNTLAVAASHEDSNATGINGDQTDNSLVGAGAAYVFTRSGTTWSQQAYVKASNTGANDYFGAKLSLSSDGNILAIGANGEDSSATGINGNQTNNTAYSSGAAYVFTRTGTTWSQQAYLKASNTDPNDRFGFGLSLNSDGSTLAVGASSESSNAIGINGDQTDNSSTKSGATYIFTRTGATWTQQAYLKASNTDSNDYFGLRLTFSSDGNTIAISALESSNATGINGNQTDNSLAPSVYAGTGAVYLFTRTGTTWSQQAYLKASNTGGNDNFGIAPVLSADGNTLAIGAWHEASNATGINGDQTDNSLAPSGDNGTGAVYLF
jgi:hypothetical protein